MDAAVICSSDNELKLQVQLRTHDDNESSSSVDIYQRGADPFPFFTATKEALVQKKKKTPAETIVAKISEWCNT